MRDSIINEYFNWLCSLVCSRRFSQQTSYEKLLMQLHSTPFIYSIPNDQNRAEDGINMRYRFALKHNYEYSLDIVMDSLDGPCSVLEMMVALSIHCEENIMDDPSMGDRTGQWFWGMIVNLGLGSMLDNRFDKAYVIDRIDRFLNHEYEPNGKGGLFTVNGRSRDLRNVEIWYQMCWYLDNIT